PPLTGHARAILHLPSCDAVVILRLADMLGASRTSRCDANEPLDGQQLDEKAELCRWAKRASAASVSTDGSAAHRQQPDPASEVSTGAHRLARADSGRRTKEATMTTKLVALVLLCLMSGTAMAQEPKVTSLMSKDLTESPGREALMITVEHAPGGSS